MNFRLCSWLVLVTENLTVQFATQYLELNSLSPCVTMMPCTNNLFNVSFTPF